MLFGVQRCNLATFAYQSVTALKQHVPHVPSDLRSDNVLASHVGHVGTYPCTHLRLTAPENSSPLHGAHRASQLPTDGGLCCLQPKKHGGSTTWCCFLGTSGGEVGGSGWGASWVFGGARSVGLGTRWQGAGISTCHRCSATCSGQSWDRETGARGATKHNNGVRRQLFQWWWRLRNGDHSASYFTSSTNEDEGGQRKVSPFASD